MIGSYVTSYYRPHNAPPSPFIGKIVGEIGPYWILETPNGRQVRALKAACSTKPTSTKPKDR
jgi:hypothetical protein